MTELIKNMKELTEQSKEKYFISKYNFLLRNEVHSTGFEHNDRIMIKNGYLDHANLKILNLEKDLSVKLILNENMKEINKLWEL